MRECTTGKSGRVHISFRVKPRIGKAFCALFHMIGTLLARDTLAFERVRGNPEWVNPLRANLALFISVSV